MKAYFVIYGFEESPETISNITGVSPDEFGIKGHRVDDTRPAIKENYWQVNSKSVEKYNIDAHISELVDIASGLINNHQDLGDYQKKIVVYSDVVSDQPKPGAFISYDLSKKLAELRVDYEIDLN